MTESFNLQREARERVLITAHRGIYCGNIPCNTLAAFDAALYCGADMIELDVARSADGELFVFHEGCEKAHLGTERPFGDRNAQEVRKLRYLNQDRNPTEHPVATFDEALEHLKGKCYINVDKFAAYMEPITAAIRRHGMQEQCVVKTDAGKSDFQAIAQVAPDLPYIAIIQNVDVYTAELLRQGVRLIGVEAVFEDEASPVCQPGYIERMHGLGLAMWGNGIVFNYKRVLSAGHTDDRSITGDPDGGWGWLIDRGFDIIQTDFPRELRDYLQGRR